MGPGGEGERISRLLHFPNHGVYPSSLLEYSEDQV